MHNCRFCKRKIGGVDEPALYAFKGNDYCKKCMESVDMKYRMSVDTAVAENEQFKKRILAGTYMKPREDAGVHGKKHKDRYAEED